MLLYLFYALPLLALLAYGLWMPGCTWMLDWSVFFAGAIAQVMHHQITYILTYLFLLRLTGSLVPIPACIWVIVAACRLVVKIHDWDIEV